MPDRSLKAPYYPIVYVRGFSVSAGGDLENTFHDAYYGFAATAVEKRQAPPPAYFVADVFEGQLIRFMKEDHEYVDATNTGLDLCARDEDLNPARSLWISRFYDRDIFQGKVRPVEEHAEDLRQLVCETIPDRLRQCGVDLGPGAQNYRVILLAHSMGGLICRTLIQNLLPARGEKAERWIYRLVTMGTPHGGIEMNAVPGFLQNLVGSTLNPFDMDTFDPPRMKEYLKIEGDDVRSLEGHFPEKNCLCLIGSDYPDYTLVQKVTGGFSDGLVKQDRAYIAGAYYANVHRAHSGFRGIVNSPESYENLRRFLFGNTRVTVSLDEIEIASPQDSGCSYFYDFEFLLSIRGTSVYLHRREQDPCENAERYKREELPRSLTLHTAFLDSSFRDDGDQFSHFTLTLRVIEHRAAHGFLHLFDREYPKRPIYVETVEIRLGDPDDQNPGATVQYRWLSETNAWQPVRLTEGLFRIPLRAAVAFKGTLCLAPAPWPDPAPGAAGPAAGPTPPLSPPGDGDAVGNEPGGAVSPTAAGGNPQPGS